MSGQRILIAEDEEAVRTYLERALAAEGYEVAAVADGQGALEALGRERFDLVLADVWMPRLGGLELLARLREEGRPVRAIVMTGDGTPETVLGAVREQAYLYLPKPFARATLVEVVERRDAASDEARTAGIGRTIDAR